MTRLHLAAAWIGLQAVFFAAWAAREGSRFSEGSGRSILVRTVPYDPRDLLRGQYLQLAYEFSRPAALLGGTGPDEGSAAWVVLAPSGEFHAPVRVDSSRPQALAPGEVALLGRSAGGRLEFGIERYFVPEGSPTPDPRDITVRLRVGDDGSPRIEEVYVRGVAWP